VPRMMEVSMRFTPQGLNPDSEGKWVKAHFVLAEGYGVEDVDTNRRAAIEPGGIESAYIDVFVNENGGLRRNCDRVVTGCFGRGRGILRDFERLKPA